MTPECNIDYSRHLSLPLAIAPGGLSSANLNTFLGSLDIQIDILNNTFTKFTPSSKVGKLKFRKISNSAGSLSLLFPYVTSSLPALPEVTVTNTQAAAVVRKGGVQVALAAGMTAVDIMKELIKKVVFSSGPAKVSAIPFPFYNLDSMRAFWIKDSTAALADTLGLNIQNAPDQTYLLKTFTDNNNVVTIGELDRLLVRAAVTGLVSFEPYYHFEISAAGLKTNCVSNSGRINLQTQNQKDNKHPRLYEETSFTYENMDRKSVQGMLVELLMFQFRNLTSFIVKNERNLATAIKTKATFTALKPLISTTPDTFKLEAPATFYPKLINSVRRAMVGWVLYVKNLGTGAGETVTYANIKTAYAKVTLFEQALNDKKAGVENMYDFAQLILGNAGFLQSFTNFLTRCYIPLCCGASWKECIDAIPGHAAAFKFPVAAGEAPKNGNDAAAKTAQNDHAWLEKIYNDLGQENAFVCYGGCPLGKPSNVYHTSTPATNTAFPDGAYTTFELEAAILVSLANTTFTRVTSYPTVTPGLPPDLSTYDSYVAGYSCSLQLITKTNFYTIVDWFQELLKETNIRRKEAAAIDITDYVAGGLHPIGRVMKFDEYQDLLTLRAKMDTLDTTGGTSVALDTLTWWLGKSIFLPNALGDAWPDGSSSNPKRPYMVDRTVFPAPDLPSSTVSFAKGDNVANASGLDVFDMECMKIAISMVKNPLTGNFDTPLPVVMALVLREGIGLFQFLNRITRPSTSLRWIGHSSWRPVPLDAAAEHHTIGRMYWLAFPYGLDTYTWDNATAPNTTGKMDTHFKSRLELLITTQPVLTGTTKEDLLSFVNERVGSDFNPGDPFPSIYKLHKRVHAVFITLMLAWFQHMHDTILNKRNGLTYTNADWTADDFSSIQDTITSVDTRRRDFITYYSMIYLLYNGSVGSWNAITNSVQNAGARGATKVRDYLLFKFVIGAGQELGPCNMLHYAIGLDAFCRLNFTTPSTAPDTTSPTGRAWI